VTVAKDNLDTKISGMLRTETSHRVIARRLFLYDFNQVFFGDQDRGFSILNEIRDHFKVPFSAIRVAGSAQLGFSYYKHRDFLPQVSDLDIAIVCPALFQTYSEFVYWTTKRYSNLTGFSRKDGISDDTQFRSNLSIGIFRPDLMPKSEKKDDWFRFFNQLSTKHADLFKSINGGIYLSEGFFEMKNSSVVDEARKV
jgi:hypothetical protein